MKLFKVIGFIVALIVYLSVVSGFISSKETGELIHAVKIHVVDSAENQFIRPGEMRQLLDDDQLSLMGKPAASINLRQIEAIFQDQQIVKNAEAYITEPGTVNIDIRQKSPFIRIFNKLGQGYYLDKEGNIIPLSRNFSPYVIVANGNISEPFRVGQTLNIFDVKHDSLPKSQMVVYDLFRLADYINSDDFWKAQIEQIYVTDKFEFELVPRIGPQIIDFGDISDMDEKFNNLKLLYQQAFNNIGWNQYERINLKYKNQVVCTKTQ